METPETRSTQDLQRWDTIVIGAGQAGLSVGYHLQQQGVPFVILDANERIGDTWRQRWDSLRLFTQARHSSLDGYPFPGDRHHFPTKDEMADYLESYAAHFGLPVRLGVRVERLTRQGEGFLLETTAGRYTAANVVVAMGTFQKPHIPAFAGELDPRILQIHSSSYRRPSQLQDGDVLLVGAANSGADIAMDLIRPGRQVWLAGRDTGHIPFRIERPFGLRIGAPFVLRVVFRKLLTVDTPIGRRVRPKVISHGGPLVRVKPKDLIAAGVTRVGRVEGVVDGRPQLDDGRVIDVANVVWCTGYRPGFSWIDLPIHGELEPTHEAGVVPDQPGLYFVGLHFLHALSSEMIQGVGRDAQRVVEHLAAHRRGVTAEAVSASVG